MPLCRATAEGGPINRKCTVPPVVVVVSYKVDCSGCCLRVRHGDRPLREALAVLVIVDFPARHELRMLSHRSPPLLRLFAHVPAVTLTNRRQMARVKIIDTARDDLSLRIVATKGIVFTSRASRALIVFGCHCRFSSLVVRVRHGESTIH